MKNIKKALKYIFSIIGFLLLVSILLGQTDIGNFDQDENGENSFISIGNEKIRFIQKGSGKDILFIHGTPGSIEDWTIMIDKLAKDFRVTAFDRLGHGFSSSNEYTYHLKDNAELAEQLIKELKLESPMIIGHSYGGSVAAYMAVHSEMKNREYLIIDSPFYEVEPNITNRLVSAPILGKGIAFISAFTIGKYEMKKGVLSMFKSPENEKNIDFYIEERQNIWSQPKVIYSNAKEIVNLPEDLKAISGKYKNIDVEMTFITAENAKSTFRKDAENLHSEVENSKLILISNTGHYIQLEQSGKVLKIINDKMEDE
jgi:pimeloyl-ACP methyl ester carboxylesterase